MNRKTYSIAFALVFALGAPTTNPCSSAAQTPASRQSASQVKPSDDVVVITTNLVQVDAVVTDKNDEPVTDLRAEDFEILEGGRAQQITNLSYIALEPSAAAQPPETIGATPAKNNATTPAVPLRPEQVRRTVALVVDELCMTQLSHLTVRDSLKKFVDEQIRVGDLVGIFSTRGGAGALQQFTNDRRQLHRAINSLRWLPARLGYNCSDAFPVARSDYRGPSVLSGAGRQGSFETEEARNSRLRGEDFDRESLAVGALGTLRFIVGGLRELPGRKSVAFFSDGIPIYTRGAGSGRAVDALRSVIDAANRASVVFYTLDARGLPITGITAEDDVLPGLPGDDVDKTIESRRGALFESQNGLAYLAGATGGRFTYNSNDLNIGLRRMLADQRGYYLIGYRPSGETFARGADKFHRIEVRVKRPDLRVRSRQGFYGLTDKEARPAARTGDRQLYAALASPLSAGDIRVRLTPFFGNDARAGAFVRALLHIEGQDISFVDEPNGGKKLVLDVAAVTLGDKGQVVDEFNRTHTVRASGETLEQIRRNGLLYTADVPVKKTGAYQFRIVVRDGASKRLGSAGQFIELPDFKEGGLALSGIILSEAKPNAAPAIPAGAAAEAALSPVESPANSAVRQYLPGSVLSYGYIIFNAKPNRSNNQPQLTTQLRLFRNGQLIFTGPETPSEAGKETAVGQLGDFGYFKINDKSVPGEYVLQVIVNDLLAGEKRRTATQAIDFEIVN